MECPLFRDVHLTIRIFIIKICSFLKCPSYWGAYLALYPRERYLRKFYMKRLFQDPTPNFYIYTCFNKGCFGNRALIFESYCLVVTQAKHCIVFCVSMTKSRSNLYWNRCIPFLPEKVSLSYTFNGAAFGKIWSRSVVLKRQSGTPINVTWSHFMPCPLSVNMIIWLLRGGMGDFLALW